MIQTKDRLFFLLSILMASVVALSNYLVQIPIQYLNLEEILTYGAFSYPIAFLITDLTNRRYGKTAAKKIVYMGFILGIFLAFFFFNKFFRFNFNKNSSRFRSCIHYSTVN